MKTRVDVARGVAGMGQDPIPTPTCRLCHHAHVGRCPASGPNIRLTCSCPGECKHRRHPDYCHQCSIEAYLEANPRKSDPATDGDIDAAADFIHAELLAGNSFTRDEIRQRISVACAARDVRIADLERENAALKDRVRAAEAQMFEAYEKASAAEREVTRLRAQAEGYKGDHDAVDVKGDKP